MRGNGMYDGMSHAQDSERDLTLRELAAKFLGFRELMAERDTRYQEKFEAAEKFSGQVSSSALAAAQKAEQAQNAYNTMHNDLSRKNELMMTRADADVRFANVEQKHEELRREIISLRESRSQLSGVAGQQKEGKDDGMRWLALAIVIGLALFGWITRSAP